jgi:hypothetical protein
VGFVWGLLQDVGRIVCLRGSPERIYYTQRLARFSVLLAVLASIAAQFVFFQDIVVFVILRVFAEVTMFMLMMVVLTAKITRLRLAKVLLVLVLISLIVDSLLAVLGLGLTFAGVGQEPRQLMAYSLALVALYGAASVLGWGLRKPLLPGFGVIMLYVLAVLGLDMSFRHLYQMIAGG